MNVSEQASAAPRGGRRSFLRALLVVAAGIIAGSAGASSAQSWTPQSTRDAHPSARDGHWMTYDSASHSILLFGGKQNSSHELNDLWSYEATTGNWQRLTPTGTLPPARFGHQLVYDSRTNELVLLGGVTPAENEPANDTWTFNTTKDRWRQTAATGPRPAPRVYPSMVYDTTAKKTVLFGGWTGSSSFGDTWTYDSTTQIWSRAQPAGAPRSRWGAAMAYDPTTHQVILFGGLYGSYDGTTRLGDTWAYDAASNKWTNLHPTGQLPAARGYAVMAYDDRTHRLILFGGFAGPHGLLGDTWSYDSKHNRWTPLNEPTHPPNRDFSAMSYDSTAGTLVMFGGLTGANGNINGTLLNDIWQH